MNKIEPTKIDATASDSCTRSGAFALLLSMALFSLIPYWLWEPAEIAQSQYYSLRLSLIAAINQLDNSFYWQKYIDSHEAAEAMPIEQLLEVSFKEKQTNNIKVQSKPAVTPKYVNKQDDKAPPAPYNFNVSIVGKLDCIHNISDLLSKLNDSDLLTKSRQTKGIFNYSIYRWALKRDSLINRNRHLSRPVTLIFNDAEVAKVPVKENMQFSLKVQVKSNKEEEEKIPEDFVPAHNKEDLLKYLTLHDIRELANFELLKIDDTIKLAGRDGREITISPNQLPRNLYMASIFLEVGLLFVIIYFGSFIREALSSAEFPVSGTLFSAFSKSSPSLAVFFLGLWSPFAASLGVAVSARKLLLIVFCVLIWFFTFSIQRDLQRKKFFELLDLRRIMHERRAGKGQA